MATEKPDAIVIFGVSSDLAAEEDLPSPTCISPPWAISRSLVIGVAKTERTPEQIRAIVRESLETTVA